MGSVVPTDKITAAGAAAAVVAVAAWVLEGLGIQVPAPVQVNLAVCLVVAAGFIKTERQAIRELVASYKARGKGEHSAD